MKLDAIHAGVQDVFGLDPETGAALYQLILKHQCRQILHTGWRTGKSIAYLAGAVQELGSGRVLALNDLLPAKTHTSVTEKLAALSLSSLVEFRHSEAGRPWLLQQIAAQANGVPRFELVVMESARDLTVDGLTLMLSERWLKPCGLLVLQGLHWTYGKSPALRDTREVKAMPALLRNTPQADLLANAIAKRGGTLEEVERHGDVVIFRKRERPGAKLRRLLGKPTLAPLPPQPTEPAAAAAAEAAALATPGKPAAMQQCPLCGHEAPYFLRHTRAGFVGRANAKCPNCGALERHRLIWLYFQRRTNLLEAPKKRLLHIAPEACLETLFKANPNIDYLSGDLESPWHPAMVVMDITDIKDYKEGDFDVVYCSHVLEHVPEDRKAIKELYRVLEPGGWAVIQVPIVFEKTFEDPSIKTPEDRERFYKHRLHIRAYGMDYKDRLEEAGFQVEVIPFYDQLSPEERKRYALKPQEPVFHCTKPRR